MIDEKKSGREDLHRFSFFDSTLNPLIKHNSYYFLISYSGV